ncbi:MAG TPA: hypothetical protein VF095_03830 [Bacillota bacterium]
MSHLVETYDTKGEFTSEDVKAIQDIIKENSKYFDNISYFTLIKKSEIDGEKVSETLFNQGQGGSGESGLIRQGIAGEVTWM